MRNTLTTMGTAAGAFLLVMGTASTAAAADYWEECALVDVRGQGWFDNWTASRVDISLQVQDTKADGHHVAIRFISMDKRTNKYKSWPWRHNYDGAGTSKYWDTYASDSNGRLNSIGIQAAVMEGSEVISNCLKMVPGSRP
ncbi:hypothetical protein [Streptomyces anulatus]|uniref:hypothetical protein n=1 Tax=Streptomyces anulatus TaxID=1892 RepID=UPI00365F6635